MTTPIKRAAEAAYDRAFTKHAPEDVDRWSDLVRDNDPAVESWRDVARAAFESIDRDELAAFLDSPTHAPMDTHSGRDGSCLDCPWPVHQLPPDGLADAIIAYLTGDQS